MLIEFKVANYRSIRAEQTLSMVANADKELPQNLISCDHVPGLKGTKLVKAVALYGANASGKSNIVAALRFFAEFVRDSATKLQPGAPTGAQPFKLDPACLTEPSKFEITAVINGIRTLYGLELNNDQVMSEYLVAYPNARPQVWFERDWNSETAEYDWSEPSKNFSHDGALRESVRSNAAFVSSAAQLNQTQALSIWFWFAIECLFLDLAKQDLSRDMALQLLRRPAGVEKLSQALGYADFGVGEAIAALTVPALIKRVTDSGYDWKSGDATSLTKVISDVKLEPPKEEEEVAPVFFHRAANDQMLSLDFDREESAGTKRFFALMGYWMHKLELGGLLVIDELETSLHPTLIQELVGTFLRSSGTHPAQLLFTTHNPLLLDQTLLRRDQIWFTEKDQEGATRLYPLTDFKPRKDESLVKGYLAGRYGGIPFIPEGLKF